MRNGAVGLFILVLGGCLSTSQVDPHFHPGVPRRLNSELIIKSSGTASTSVAMGTALVGGELSKTLTLENTGFSDITSISTTFSTTEVDFLGGTYPGTGGDCTDALVIDDSCTIVIGYTPASVSTLSATVTLAYQDATGAQTKAFSLTATALNPGILGVSNSPSYDFGDVLQDIGTEKAFTLSNSGDYPISDIQVSGLSAPFSIRGTYPGTCGNCTTSLAAGASCTLAITYRPTTATLHSGSFTISYESGVDTESSTINLTGTAIDPDTVVPGPPDPNDYPASTICR